MFKRYFTGLQHIGIPTKDMEKTIAFYTGLGFTQTFRLQEGGLNVVFLESHGLVIEAYAGDATEATGAIDHIALNVTDIEAVFQAVKENGYKLIDSQQIVTLPFFANGCSFFLIEGPNKERIEFNQIL